MIRLTRRLFLVALTAALAACAALSPSGSRPPIVFVHGNGDSAALWQATVWRFESNGWPRDRLFAVDLPYPLARTDDAKAQEGRSSAAENMRNLAAEVARVRRLTGADKVALYGNSRGGNAIRDFIRNGGGAGQVSAAILGGTPNHGVWAGDFLPGNEFNGNGPFLRALNSPQGADGLEVTPGVRFLTLRSDRLDKYAQPDGRWVGQPKMQTHIGPEGPALKGAENVVLPGRDHREVSYHADAFAQAWRFLTGEAPAHLRIVQEATVFLEGRITGMHGNDPTNLPLAGATIEVYETVPATGERKAGAVYARTVGGDGHWGPFAGRPDATYEFVVHAPGFAVSHVYRSPFPRSSSLVSFRPARLADADKAAGAVVTMTRPSGYFGAGRDTMSLDGAPPPGIPPGVPGVASSTLRLKDAVPRTVIAVFNDERIAVRTWPAAQNHVAFAEFRD